MMKKHFAMTIIAASVALVACSDDDDDDEGGNGNNGAGMEQGSGGGAAPFAPNENPALPALTVGEGSSAFDTVANSDAHTTLESLITLAGLAQTLDDPGAEFTIFAPTDAAFTALEEAAPGTTATLTQEGVAEADQDFSALARILKGHVLAGTVQSGAVTDGIAAATADAPFAAATLATGEPAQSLTFGSNEEDGAPTITDGSGNTIPLPLDGLDLGVSTEVGAPTTGVVHSLNNVLITADAAPEETGGGENGGGENGGGENGGGGEDIPPASGGAGDALLVGNSEAFRTGIANDFNGFLDSQAWTFFVPSDETVGGTASLTAAQLQAHIHTNGAVAPADLATLNSITVSNNASYAVATDASGAVTVGGFPVELIGTGEAGAQIYSVGGVLGN